MNPLFHRTQLLVGDDGVTQLKTVRVIIFGVGGVGSWCAEALIRSGIEHLTIVDSDRVCVTNINRQLQATISTVGEVKVQALRNRLLDINPRAQITAIEGIYDASTAKEYDLSSFEYVIDAIDSLTPKVDLICHAITAGATLYSSMGLACKIDPTRLKIDSVWNSRGCPLARIVRERLKKRGMHKKFLCIYSEELLENHEGKIGCGTGNCVCPTEVTNEAGEKVVAHEWCSHKAQINGSLVHMTGIAGFMLAGLVIQDAGKRAGSLKRIR